MPQILKSARDGQIKVKAYYTTGDLAHMMGVAHSTAIRLIDSVKSAASGCPPRNGRGELPMKL